MYRQYSVVYNARIRFPEDTTTVLWLFQSAKWGHVLSESPYLLRQNAGEIHDLWWNNPTMVDDDGSYLCGLDVFGKNCLCTLAFASLASNGSGRLTCHKVMLCPATRSWFGEILPVTMLQCSRWWIPACIGGQIHKKSSPCSMVSFK